MDNDEKMNEWADALQKDAENNAKEYIENLKSFDLAIFTITSASIPTILLFLSRIEIFSLNQLNCFKIIVIISVIIIISYLIMRIAEAIMSYKRAKLFNSISNAVKSSKQTAEELNKIRRIAYTDINNMSERSAKFRKWVEIYPRIFIFITFTTNLFLFALAIFIFSEPSKTNKQNIENTQHTLEIKLTNDINNRKVRSNVKYTNHEVYNAEIDLCMEDCKRKLDVNKTKN